MKPILLAAVLGLVLTLGCYEDRPVTVSDNGTVTFISLEGGFFGIIDDHGRHWDPSNLPKEFQADSLRLRFEGVVTDRITAHMWGRTIELTAVKRIN